MSDFLQQMAASSEERAASAKTPAAHELDSPVIDLALGRFDVIAELKSRSPAEGQLAGQSLDRCAQARRYADGGAAAISVLTEPERFDGELAHLREVVAAVPAVPVMRKDFLVDPVQVLEARAAGASGVLLIIAMLDDRRLRSMLDCAAEHNLFVLLEAFDAADLERIKRLLGAADTERVQRGKLLFGVNTRNLRTLEVDTARLQTLASELPEGRCVAESGILTAEDAERVASFGYTLALVGTALMRSANPQALVSELRAAGERGLPA